MPDYQHFTTQERDGVHIVYLTSVDATPDVVKQVGTDLMDFAQAENPQRLLVNFKSVARLSAPVIGKLLVFIRTIKAGGGVVECCEAPEGFAELLGVIGRSLPFDHVNEPEAAVVEILKRA
jgi:hypothetical protein